MKHLILIMIAISGTSFAGTCTHVGNFTYCSDGSTANQVGNTTFFTQPTPQPDYSVPRVQVNPGPQATPPVLPTYDVAAPVNYNNFRYGN